ncbi:hypothetical protein CAOG_03619 [Capsaspora owczarzaki ATCC 30864]|uniref:hypothetical protein n=1 Tax=Capsaspora owczarzaki (strain ATCC 30864) TaxID=595528 RepID=UPI0003527063|nr:hypothetical protein CAOG_03619 [Capsaspora owczarzaki ATCC 30864]|eukprot:XP_004363347.2 hypothetical protein CAOG_03619 [Capsaspora owczarzaki ATCC 30864]
MVNAAAVQASPSSSTPLPSGWEQSRTDEGLPYFVDHNNGTTEWTDPRIDFKFKHEEYKNIRFAAYRAVIKLRHVQMHTSLRKLSFRNLLDAIHNSMLAGRNDTFTSGEMLRCLTFAFELASISEPKECATHAVHWLLCVYDRLRTGAISAFDFKIGTSTLVSGQLADKFRYAFSLVDSDNDGMISQTQLAQYIVSLAKIVVDLAEMSADLDTSEEGINKTVTACFDAAHAQKDNKLPLKAFMHWMLADQSVIVFVPLLARFNYAESVVHNARCKVCGRNPIVGLRYRCLKCFGFDVCQTCFLSGREAQKHKVNHPLLEYCYPEKNALNVFGNRLKNVGKKWDWQLPASGDYISQSSDIDLLIARERMQATELAALPKKGVDVTEGGDDSNMRAMTAAEDQETHVLIGRLANRLGALGAEGEVAPATVQAGPTIIHQHIIQQAPPGSGSPRYDIGVQATEFLDAGTQTDFLAEPRRVAFDADEMDGAVMYAAGAGGLQVKNAVTPISPNSSVKPLDSTAGAGNVYNDPNYAALAGQAAMARPAVVASVPHQESVSDSTVEEYLAQAGLVGAAGSTLTAGKSIKRKSTLNRQNPNGLIEPSELELLAEEELLAASADLEAVVKHLNAVDDYEEPGFGEQLLQAARAIAESTSMLVSQAASTRRTNVGWSEDVADKAKAMHTAAAQLAEQIKTDAEGGQVSEEQLIATAKAVEAASDALLQVVDNEDETKFTPMAKEAKSTLRKARVQFDELVDFAETEAQADDDDDGTTISVSGENNDEFGPLSGLRQKGGSFTQRLTLKRQSIQDKAVADRWLRIMFAIEEEAGMDVPGVTEDNVLNEMPRRLKDGVLACHLLRAFLPDEASLEPVEPAPGTSLPTIRIMENLEKFLEGCKTLGVPEKSMCNIYDIMEGRRPIKVVNCLETVIALGNQKKTKF